MDEEELELRDNPAEMSIEDEESLEEESI